METTQRSHLDRHRLSAALADKRSRCLLDCVQDGPATVRDLTVALAAAGLDCTRSAVTAADRQQYRRQLHHCYLPRLTDVGFIDRSADGFVRYVPGVLDSFEVQFPSLDEPTHPSWPAATAAVSRAYRYPLVAAVAETGVVSVSGLADRLAGTTAVTDIEEPPTPRDLSISLHHVDLPKLASVDLLTYDPDERTVSSEPAIGTVL